MTERNMRCGNNNTCIYHVGGEGGGGGFGVCMRILCMECIV